MEEYQKSIQIFASVMSPEMRLVICLSQSHIDYITSEKIKLLIQKKINWKYVIEIASEHGLISFVYKGLQTVCPNQVPFFTLRKLEHLFWNNLQRNLLITGELTKIIKLLQKEEIKVFPYSGIIFEGMTYNDIGLYPLDKLDLVVQEKDFFKLQTILIQKGYESELELLSQSLITSVEDYNEYSYRFVHPKKKIYIEIYWLVTDKYSSLDITDYFWQKLEPSSILGVDTDTLPLEDYLLLHCMYADNYSWRKLIWPWDIAEIIRKKSDIDWDKLILVSDNLNSRQVLFTGLFLAHHLFGASLPDVIIQKIESDKDVITAALEIAHQLFYFRYIEDTVLNFSFDFASLWKAIISRK
jgi:Uncharacterised nucleotidyltransferase